MRRTTTQLCSGLLTGIAGLLAAPPACPAPESLPLSALLANTDQALSVLEADAEAESARQDTRRERAESGLRVSFGGGYGIVRNIVDVHKAFTYDATQAQAGFSYPLLGAAEAADRRVDAALGKQHQMEIRAQAARSLAQLELEAAYARYWGAQESLQVVQAYLASENLILPKLSMRVQHQLSLASVQLDAEAAYAEARSDEARFRRGENDARERLQRLTGRQLGSFTAQPVSVPPVPQVQLDSLLQHHPELSALRAQRDALQAQLHDSAWYGLEASLDVSAAGVRDVSQGGPNGGTAFVGLNFKAPIDVFSARSAQRKGLRAQIDEMELKIRDRGQELSGEAQSAMEQVAQFRSDDERVSQRVQAGRESLRESYERRNAVAEEGVDALAQRLHGYYSAALEDIDTRMQAWLANVALRGYAIAADSEPSAASADASAALGAELAEPIVQIDQMLQGQPPAMPSPPPPAPRRSPHAALDQPGHAAKPAAYAGASGFAPQPAVLRTVVEPATMMSDAAPASAGPADQPVLTASLTPVAAPAGSAGTAALGVYVWHAGEVIARAHDAGFWQGLQRMPVNRLLLGLNAGEIAAARSRPQELGGFLDAARQHGVAVELLLGDPGWIDPAQRPKLLAIIEGLRGFGFAGLNLDIEPDQVYRQPLSQGQFDAWIATLRAAAAASPWPVAVTVHPRYFRDQPYLGWNLDERLRQAHIEQVVLMVFNSKPQRVADITRPIVGDPRAAGLRFRVAQSVEPELEPELSYAHRSPQEFQQSMSELQRLLAAQPNTDGVVVQAWNDLLRMGYESSIR